MEEDEEEVEEDEEEVEEVEVDEVGRRWREATSSVAHMTALADLQAWTDSGAQLPPLPPP